MRRGLVCAMVVPAICLAGCGGGDDDATPNQAATSTQQTTDAAAAQEEARTADIAALKEARARRYRRYLKVALRSQEGKSAAEQLRIAEAVDKLAQLAKEDLSAVAPLVAALEKKDYDRIIKLQFFFIRLGKPRSERVLLDALEHAGDTPEGTEFSLALLQSGNRTLENGTRRWASRHDVTITGDATPAVGTSWGCLGVYRDRPANAPPTGLEC